MAENVGTMQCLVCGQGIPVKVTGGGALSVNCTWCDFSGYAKKGTQAARLIQSRMTADKAPEPAPDKPAKPAGEGAQGKDTPAPAAKPRATAGGLPWMR